MSTAVPEQRTTPQLTDEQVIKLDWWYPHTAGRAVAYAVWLYLFTLGFTALADLLSWWNQNDSIFSIAVGAAVGGALGATLSRGSRREKMKLRHKKQVLKAQAQGQTWSDDSLALRPSNLYLVGVGAATGLAYFGLLNLITHLGLFEATTGFTLAMCFVMAAITTWVTYKGSNDRKENVS